VALTITTTSTGEGLTTLSALKDLLGVVGSSEETLLTALIVRASAACDRYCQRMFLRQTYTETVSGIGGPYLQLAVTPLRSITSVMQSGVALSDYSIEDPEAGWLYRERGWDEVPRWGWDLTGHVEPGGELPTYTVVYQAGYLLAGSASSEGRTLPGDLEQAALETAQAWYLARGRDPELAAKKIGELALTYRPATDIGEWSVPLRARGLLAPYRRSV
jgi:hypothetical protein